MKKIKITLILAEQEEYPGCGDVLATCNEFEIIARHHGLGSPGIRDDLSRSDIVLFDEAAVIHDGREAVRGVHERFPFARILLIIEKNSRNKTMEALSMGITGVMERASIVASIRKAIPVLCSGETWVSRRLVGALHSELKYAGDEPLFPNQTEWPADIKN